MRIINSNDTVETTQSAHTVQSVNSADAMVLAEAVTHKTYHEMADVPVIERDALAQLHTNLQMLEDLQGRLSFVMKEVRYMMKL